MNKHFPKMPFPKTETTFYPFKGGLDLLTPAIAVDPGKCFDSQNYVPEIAGGYRRMSGHERKDGRPSPTAMGFYWVMSATITGAVTVGATLTGNTSTATGRVLGVFGAVIVLGRVTGTYVAAEALKIAGVTVATSTSTALQGGAPLPSDDADYSLLAANDLRADIQPPPGSGPVRGVQVYADNLYCFKDNVGATAGQMWKATAGGWVQVAFGREIQFSGAVGQINDGDTITGGTSGATAPVVRAMLRTGTWTVGGAGTLIIGAPTGTFVSGEALKVAAVTKATSATAVTNIARAPGGRVETIVANFTGLATTRKMYGADGVNPAFEFDGVNYIPIRTGMTVDTPTHLIAHVARLFLSFAASVQYSQAGQPYAWSVVVGAGEIATGENVSGFLEQSGTSAGSALAVLTDLHSPMLYGDNNLNFVFTPSRFDLGYSAYTMQQVGNKAYGLTSRGIQALGTTQEYGNFLYASVSYLLTPLLQAKRGLQTASTVSQQADEYRLFFNDGTALVVGLTGDKPNGIMPLNYGRVVRCITAATLSTGEEVTYFGCDDGFVYQDNVGTSFDGLPIEAWIRPVFNNLKSPQMRKQYRSATFEVKTEGYSEVQVSYDFGYANPEVSSSAMQSLGLIGAGGYWGQIFWDKFTWSAKTVNNPRISIDGTETNISFLFYSKRAQDKPHTVQGTGLTFTVRRLERGS